MEAAPADTQGTSCSHTVGGRGPKRRYREGPSTVGGEGESVAKRVQSAASVSGEELLGPSPQTFPHLPRTLLRVGSSSLHFKKRNAFKKKRNSNTGTHHQRCLRP